ncbi:MAG TPA: GAF domain-containing sensor histidine kinase [Elainellaceae cyanobacterium]
MISPKNKFFNPLDGNVNSPSGTVPATDREQQRLATLSELGLLDADSVPVFEEATQTAAHFLDAPICILGLIDRDRHWFKSAIGLSRIGLMNSLASSRQLPRQESFCSHVVENQKVLAISDAAHDPNFATRLLVSNYGIKAYLGVPLIASNGCYLGTLAIMELAPRNFTRKEIEFLELTARWSMSEFERNHLLKQRPPDYRPDHHQRSPLENRKNPSPHLLASTVKTDLIAQMTQELRTPLTSILGMASVLNREIYGPLTDKQKKYMDIVHTSGQYMLSIVNEILELGALDERSQNLNLSPVDIEMLCQQAIGTLEQVSKQREQQIQLSVEPGRRVWLLDKDKVRQMLYHLAFRVIQSSSACSIIRIHVSRKRDRLNIAIWITHPWLGDGLPHAEVYPNALTPSPRLPPPVKLTDPGSANLDNPSHSTSQTDANAKELKPARHQGQESDLTRHNLGLMLTRQLVDMHGGNLAIQGSLDAGYRYVISLPQITDGQILNCRA